MLAKRNNYGTEHKSCFEIPEGTPSGVASSRHNVDHEGFWGSLPLSITFLPQPTARPISKYKKRRMLPPIIETF